MSKVEFKYLKVTTMTVVMPMDGEVDLDRIFPLLEITRIDLPVTKRQTQKFKIPCCKIPGAILSARYKGITRGIVKSQSKRYFLNAITIDVSTLEKNVNIKLSKSKMQMCGATSLELAKQAAQYIIDHITRIQNMLEYIDNNPEIAKLTIDWIKEKTRGPPKLIILSDDNQLSQSIINHTITVPETIDPNVDKRIVEFILRFANEMTYHEDFCYQIDWICQLKSVVNKIPQILEFQKVMVNYNYDLGFNIDRKELVKRINGLNGFTARYENTVDHSVTIELPYKIPEGMRITKRKGKIPCHTFLVYRSGLVTQSGPNEDLMKPAYEYFNATINEIKEYVGKPGGLRKLKYSPCYNRIMTNAEIRNLQIIHPPITINPVIPLKSIDPINS